MLVFLVTAAVLAIGGCDNFNLYQQFPSLEAAELRINPAVAAVFVTKTVNFSATGGAGGYVFDILSGNGSIDAIGGVFTASISAGETGVRVTDRFGDYRDAVITILEAQELFITPISVYVSVGGTFNFAAYGGVPPYEFYRQSGVGSIALGTGIYTAPADLGGGSSAIIRVEDAAGSQKFATLTVVQADGDLYISPVNPVIDEFDTVVFQGSGGSASPDYSFAIVDSPDGSIIGNTYTPGGVGVDIDTVELSDINDGGIDPDTTKVTVIPAAPEDVDADGSEPGAQAIRVSWSEVSVYATQYRLERREGASGLFSEVVTLSAGSVAPGLGTYVDNGLSPSTFYSYQVIAIAPGGLESNPSNIDFDESNPQ